MINQLEIFIIKGVIEPWLSSSTIVYSSIISTLKSIEFALFYNVVQCESFSDLPSSRKDNRIRVVICHIDHSNEEQVLYRKDEFLWIFVSGGQHVVSESFRDKMERCRTIWFQGAYKRENNFAHWIKHWIEQKIDITNFCSSEEALLFAASGPMLHLVKLHESLHPLMILISGFCSFSDKPKIQIDAPIINELSMGINEILKVPGLLDKISSEATLLDGWLASKKDLNSEKVKLYRDALYYLIPHDYGHWGDYNPKLDLDLIALAEDRLPLQKVANVVELWQERLAVMFQEDNSIFK